MNQCINCKGEQFQVSVKYVGASECVGCGMLKSLQFANVRSNVILPEDPMDALLCDGCT